MTTTTATDKEQYGEIVDGQPTTWHAIQQPKQ